MNKKSERSLLLFSISLRFLTQASQYFYYILMPFLVVGLASQPHLVKLSVSVFFLGLTISLFIAGPIIDTIGEMKSFWLSIFIFLMGTFICSFSTSIFAMMGGRFIQALAGGCLQILSKSLIMSSKNRAASLPIYQMVLHLAPPIAMLLTSLVLYFFVWQASFILLLSFSMGILGISLFGSRGVSSSPVATKGFYQRLKIYRLLIKQRGFLPLVFSYGTIYSLMAPFYVTATYTLVQELHYNPHDIALISVCFAMVEMSGNYMSLWLGKHNFQKIIIPLGLMFAIVGCLLFLLCSLLFPPSLLLIVLPIIFLPLGYNLVYAQLNTYIVSRFEHISKNSTLSAQAIAHAGMSSLATALTAFHQHKVVTQTASLMLFLILIASVLYWLYKDIPANSTVD